MNNKKVVLCQLAELWQRKVVFCCTPFSSYRRRLQHLQKVWISLQRTLVVCTLKNMLRSLENALQSPVCTLKIIIQVWSPAETDHFNKHHRKFFKCKLATVFRVLKNSVYISLLGLFTCLSSPAGYELIRGICLRIANIQPRTWNLVASQSMFIESVFVDKDTHGICASFFTYKASI